MKPNLDELAPRVRALRPDLVVSWFWTNRIPRPIFEAAPFGGLNVHPSLLPRHRGADPYFWTIDSGDPITGVTAHRIDEHYDTGAIYAQREMPVDPSWSAWTLARKLDRPSLALLRETVARFARGEPPTAVPQDESRATDAPAPSDDDLVVQWKDTSDRIARRIRAASPWPGMWAEIGHHPVLITRAEPTDDVPRALMPTEAAVVNGSVVVRTGDRGLRLISGRDVDTDLELGTKELASLITLALG
ncbi:methionyl-tRNA formyltransferase [Pendulispora albinea]|uniref:Methionyl-tRNA formyltransferase n=1 Tax=Pendulispora albinea TaxID=2741071 RepID=A0ABZ2LUB6_9BACT